MSSKQASTQKALNKAINFYQKGNLAQATKYCQQVLSKEKHNIDAIQLLAILKGQTGEEQAGIKLLLGLIKTKNDSPLIWENLGKLYYSVKDFTKAVHFLGKAYQANPSDTSLRNILNQCLAADLQQEQEQANQATQDTVASITVPDVLNSKFQEKIILAELNHGLGNRLRAYASVKALAERKNYRLVCIWKPDYHLNCKFHDLFLDDIEIIESTEHYDLNQFKYYNYMVNEEGVIWNTLPDMDEVNVPKIYIRSARVINTKISYWDEECEILRKLTPVEEVQKVIQQYELSKTIGLHIRMVNDFFDECSEKDRKNLYRYRIFSHYSIFAHQVESILKQNPQQTFFMASDNHEAYQFMQEKFGHKIQYIERKSYENRSRQQLTDALIEVLLLSQCQLLLGSGYSAFTELVSRLSGKKVFIAGRDF